MTQVLSGRASGRSWFLMLLGAALLGLVAAVSNYTTVERLAGADPEWEFLRLLVSKLVNSATVWAAISFVAGWVIDRPVQSLVAGVLASELALVMHYGVGAVTGIVSAEVFYGNRIWFVAAVVLGVPLAWLGRRARVRDLAGRACRLTLPVGFLAEPFVYSMFSQPPFGVGWPARWSSIGCGGLLIVTGLAGLCWALGYRLGRPRVR